MGCIGSPNYLNLSPYKITTSFQRNTKSFTSHWFLIQVISMIIDISTFGNSKQIYFSSENMVANGWFKMHLNQEQFNFLIGSTYFKLYPIENQNKIIIPRTLEDTGYYVHASKDWTPPPESHVVSRISDTIFYVENLHINEEIQNDPRILKINPSGIKKQLNRYISGFLQSGHQQSTYSNNIFAPIRPIHNLGLNGSNQIINVVDSGVDVKNAFFYDPNPENDLLSITGKTNVNHRKIVRIEPIVDNTDMERGHGTHVAGTAVGSAFCGNCGLSQYNGIAPASKLYFSDIGNSTSGELSGTVDLSEQYKIFEDLGVHISSNSWGWSRSNREAEFNYNKAAFEHPNILYVFAAGNSMLYNTIYCPGNSKNVLTVSASESISSSYLELYPATIEIQNETNSIQANEITEKLIFKNSVSEKVKYYVDLTLKTFLLQPIDEPFESYYKNSVVFLNPETGHDEELCERAKNVTLYGASASIFVSDDDYFSCEDPQPTIPMLKLANKADMKSLFEMYKKMSLLPFSGEEREIPVAGFMSSKGPADSALQKPDIILPGNNIYSANAREPEEEGEEVEVTTSYNDNVFSKSGSSMATPAASGLAAIVLQYLKEGFYPGLTRGSGKSITDVTSCLLKAMLVNTAVKPDMDDGESKSRPRNDVGFGTPFIHKILGFNDTGLRFVDGEKIGSNQHKVYKVKVESNKVDLCITLSYLDPPLDIDNDAILFADLDMYVKGPNGQIYNGNNVSDGDTFSLIERVVFDKGEIPENGGEFEIHVVSNRFPIDSLNVIYSIVVNGPFDMKNENLNPLFLSAVDASNNDCPFNCNGNGKCQNGHCICDDSFVGLSCGSKFDDLKGNSVVHNNTYKHRDVRYLRVPLIEGYEKVVKIEFDFIKSYSEGPVYFCTSLADSPGKLTDSVWDCHLACPKTDPSAELRPLFANYSFDVPLEDSQKFFNLVIYTGSYEPETITIDNLKLTRAIKPTDSDEIKGSGLFPVISIPFVVIACVFVIAAIIIAYLLLCRKKTIKEDKSSVTISLIENQDKTAF